MDRKKLEDGIRKTGFVLENQVAQILGHDRWTVISNKYYVDDLQENVREIDLVAYKAQKFSHLNVYTVLIISCKKSAENIWAMLARDINPSNPNIDWWPLHYWTNDKALNFKLSKREAAQDYHNGVASLGVQEAVEQPPVEVFAFQEMSKKDGKPQNDKSIFLSVTSLMKAQAYELERLPLRKKEISIYQFNLLSVVDAQLALLMFEDNCINCTEVDSVHYIARYIVKKRDTFSRIRFLRSDIFAHALEDYGRLHEANVRYFIKLQDEFFEGILGDRDRYTILSEDFINKIAFRLRWRIEDSLNNEVKIKDFSFFWNNDPRLLIISSYNFNQTIVNFLNNDPKSQEIIKSALADVYRYVGDFIFEFDDVPF